MPFVDYEPELSLREARARYFERADLGEGGYADRWVVLRARGLPIGAFPNSAQRVRSVRIHDLHHVLAGYDTSWVGEAEIGAWELASGCRDHVAAWVLNSLAVLVGVLLAPRAVAAAFHRGRRTRNLYGDDWDEQWLDRSVGEMRAKLDLF